MTSGVPNMLSCYSTPTFFCSLRIVAAAGFPSPSNGFLRLILPCLVEELLHYSQLSWFVPRHIPLSTRLRRVRTRRFSTLRFAPVFDEMETLKSLAPIIPLPFSGNGDTDDDTVPLNEYVISIVVG